MVALIAVGIAVGAGVAVSGGIFFVALVLASFWTSCGHRCRPFSPSVLAFNFYRA